MVLLRTALISTTLVTNGTTLILAWKCRTTGFSLPTALIVAAKLSCGIAARLSAAFATVNTAVVATTMRPNATTLVCTVEGWTAFPSFPTTLVFQAAELAV